MAEHIALCHYCEPSGFLSCGIKQIRIGDLRWQMTLFQKAVGHGSAAAKQAPAPDALR